MFGSVVRCRQLFCEFYWLARTVSKFTKGPRGQSWKWISWKSLVTRDWKSVPCDRRIVLVRCCFQFEFRCLLVTVMALTIGACQPIPRPFQDDHPAVQMFPPNALGVSVQPPGGISSKSSFALAKAMADALVRNGLPASVASKGRGYVLKSAVKAETEGSFTHLIIEWILFSPNGEIVKSQTDAADVSSAPWSEGDVRLTTALVTRAAPIFARSIQGEPAIEHQIEPVTVAVRSVTGALGNGQAALTRAITAVLRQSGWRIEETPSNKANYELTGVVQIDPPKEGQQTVRIIWTLKAAGGSEIGTVKQENVVPTGRLDNNWAEIAYDVATAAASGIITLAKGAPSPH